MSCFTKIPKIEFFYHSEFEYTFPIKWHIMHFSVKTLINTPAIVQQSDFNVSKELHLNAPFVSGCSEFNINISHESLKTEVHSYVVKLQSLTFILISRMSLSDLGKREKSIFKAHMVIPLSEGGENEVFHIHNSTVPTQACDGRQNQYC